MEKMTVQILKPTDISEASEASNLLKNGIIVIAELSGIADKQSADDLAKLFLAGCKDILSAALVVGLASGITFVLRDGKVIDTRKMILTK